MITATYRDKKLIKRHDRLVRKTFGKFYQLNCCVFETARVLNLFDIYKFHVCVQIFKTLKLEEHPVVASSFECIFPSHDYAARNRHGMVVPFPRIVAFKNVGYPPKVFRG